MIHLLKMENQVATLYNTDAKEIKRVSLATLSVLASKGMKLANEEQSAKILSDFHYKKYVKEVLNGTKFLVADIDNEENTEEVTRINIDPKQYANVEVYRLISITDNNKNQIETLSSLRFPVDYGVLSGTSYEEAVEQFKHPNEDLMGFMEVNSLWGSIDVSWAVEDTAPNLYWSKVITKSDSYEQEEEVQLVDGITHIASNTFENLNCNKVTLPPSVMCIPRGISLNGSNIGTFDMSKVGIKEVSLSVSTYSDYAFQELVLPNQCDTITLLCNNRDSTKNNLTFWEDTEVERNRRDFPKLISNMIFIPKSVKRIAPKAVKAFVVVIERGIELEYLSPRSIIARHIVMSDDPHLQDYINHSFERQNNQVEINLGSHLRKFSIDMLDLAETAFNGKVEGSYSNTIRCSDTLLVENVDRWPGDLTETTTKIRLENFTVNGKLELIKIGGYR